MIIVVQSSTSLQLGPFLRTIRFMLSKADQSLVKRLLAKDETALREFYSLYKDSLLQYLLRTLDQEDAEEVLQDAYLQTLEALRNFRGQSSLKTFLYSIAKRRAIDKLRKKKIKKIFFSYFPQRFVDSLATVLMKDDLDEKYLEGKIERVLKDLPNDYALVLRLKYKEGYKVADIAKEIKLSFKATESLIFRARKSFVTTYNTYERQGVFSFKKAIQ